MVQLRVSVAIIFHLRRALAEEKEKKNPMIRWSWVLQVLHEAFAAAECTVDSCKNSQKDAAQFLLQIEEGHGSKQENEGRVTEESETICGRGKPSSSTF